MRLDGVVKGSVPRAPRVRTMGRLARLGLMLYSRRLIYGVGVTVAVLGLAYANLFTSGVEPRCWVSMAGDTATTTGVVSQVDFIAGGKKDWHRFRVWYTYAVGGTRHQGWAYHTGPRYREGEALEVTHSRREPSCSCVFSKCPAEQALFTIIFGGPALLIALLMIRSGAGRIRKTIAIIESGSITSATVGRVADGEATARYRDSAGGRHRLTVTARGPAAPKKDDQIPVVFHPALPANALAIDALPRFVRTTPALPRGATTAAAGAGDAPPPEDEEEPDRGDS